MPHSPRDVSASTSPHTSVQSRRRVLWMLGAGCGVAALAPLSGCAVAEKLDPPPLRLQPLLDAAQADIDLLAEVREQYPADSPVARALETVSSTRTIHRDTLADSLAADGAAPATEPSSAPPQSSAGGVHTTSPAAAPTARDVADRLRGAALHARDVAAQDVGYRRALAASVAAACTVAADVVLGPVLD